MKENISKTLLLASLILCSSAAFAADPPSASHDAAAAPVKIKPKGRSASTAPGSGPIEGGGLLAPDPDLIDTPTTAVLDYGGYSSRSRFYNNGGFLQWVSFGVYQGVNIGGSLPIDSLIGSGRDVRVRAPSAQVKWRFYDGDHWLPSLATGYDGQGYAYNSVNHRYDNKQRGFFVAAGEELGVPGLMTNPSINISDFDGNSFYGSIPVSYNIRDKVLLMMEWDNIQNFYDSRLNAGFRVYMTAHFAADLEIRGIGQGGFYNNGDSRGRERIIQLRYSSNF